MPKYVRLGDTSDHGGKVISSSQKFVCEGALVARIDDDFDCPIHGVNKIIEGSSTSIVEGKRPATVGDHTACGAALMSTAARSNDA